MYNELIKCDGCGLFIAAKAYDRHILRCCGYVDARDDDTLDTQTSQEQLTDTPS